MEIIKSPKHCCHLPSHKLIH